MENLTPEQLRELADRIELENGVSDEPFSVVEPKRERKPYMRRVEVNGIELDVDMRRIKDYRTVKYISQIDKGDTFAVFELADFILGESKQLVIDKLSDSDGFCDAEVFVSFCTKLLEEVGSKN